jgi:hypothetical protein
MKNIDGVYRLFVQTTKGFQSMSISKPSSSKFSAKFQMPTILFPRRLCETKGGNIAYTVGRIAFMTGRPMLVEHPGGLYLEHHLDGAVLTPGYGEEYNVVYIFSEERTGKSLASTLGALLLRFWRSFSQQFSCRLACAAR